MSGIPTDSRTVARGSAPAGPQSRRSCSTHVIPVAVGYETRLLRRPVRTNKGVPGGRGPGCFSKRLDRVYFGAAADGKYAAARHRRQSRITGDEGGHAADRGTAGASSRALL